MSRRIVVLADDRTGALETAGALARRGRPVAVVPWPARIPEEPGNHVVIDLGTRHLDPATAAARVRSVLSGPGAADATVLLKIDSTLRGNWPHEVRALLEVGGHRVMVVPAFPAAGRVCVDGVVMAHGEPVADGPAGLDPRTPLRSSRPAELLALAGVDRVSAAATPDAARRWYAGEVDPVVVCDVATDPELDRLGRLWAASPGLALAGTAASVAAAVAALEASEGRHEVVEAPPALPEPAMVGIGSLHPVARHQARRLMERGWTVERAGHDPTDVGVRHVVVTDDRPEPGRGAEPAAEVAASIARHLGSSSWRSLVVVGGDTAEAVIGSRVVEVGGLLAPGVPWGHLVGHELVVVAKPGGFGDPDTIAELFEAAP